MQTQKQQLKFLKIQGCGNNFVVLEADQADPKLDWSNISRHLLDRNFGIGGDGLMLISASDKQDFSVKMYNPDGSPSGMCGNGVRCVVRYLMLQGKVEPNRESVSLDFDGRFLECKQKDLGRIVDVNMGPAKVEKINQSLTVDGKEIHFTSVSIGNPHAVIFVPSIDQIDLPKIGPKIENHQFFPNRTNVEFVEIISAQHLKMRVWERGAGITLACGSGACAIVAAGLAQGLCKNECTVDLPGGQVQIKIDPKDQNIHLIGPAQEVFEGSVAL